MFKIGDVVIDKYRGLHRVIITDIYTSIKFNTLHSYEYQDIDIDYGYYNIYDKTLSNYELDVEYMLHQKFKTDLETVLK